MPMISSVASASADTGACRDVRQGARSTDWAAHRLGRPCGHQSNGIANARCGRGADSGPPTDRAGSGTRIGAGALSCTANDGRADHSPARTVTTHAAAAEPPAVLGGPSGHGSPAPGVRARVAASRGRAAASAMLRLLASPQRRGIVMSESKDTGRLSHVFRFELRAGCEGVLDAADGLTCRCPGARRRADTAPVDAWPGAPRPNSGR